MTRPDPDPQTTAALRLRARRGDHWARIVLRVRLAALAGRAPVRGLWLARYEEAA